MDPLLSCRQVSEFLGEYFDGSLAEAQKREFERHLAVCPPCIHYLESYKTTIALAKRTCAGHGGGKPAEPVPEELVQAILAAKRKAT